eukprot:2920937-Karenia_brevis.AAC.1
MAQLRGRGLADELPPANPDAYVFHKFPRCSYADPNLDATQWAAMAAKDSNAGAISCGNHVCRDSVCRKGKLGKMGLCRLGYWSYMQAENAKNEAIMKRSHGNHRHQTHPHPHSSSSSSSSSS